MTRLVNSFNKWTKFGQEFLTHYYTSQVKVDQNFGMPSTPLSTMRPIAPYLLVGLTPKPYKLVFLVSNFLKVVIRLILTQKTCKRSSYLFQDFLRFRTQKINYNSNMQMTSDFGSDFAYTIFLVECGRMESNISFMKFDSEAGDLRDEM